MYGLTFNYGQISMTEVEHARTIAEKLEIPIKVIDLSSLKEVFAGVTSLVDNNIQMTSTFSQPIIVPFRNAIFLSVAVAYAVSINSKKIFYGAQKSDAQNYPDCRKEFYESFEQTARLGTDVELEIEAPFSNIPKSEGIYRKLGHTLIELTQEDMKLWYAAVKPIQLKWVQEMEAKGLPGRKVFEEAVRLAKKYKEESYGIR